MTKFVRLFVAIELSEDARKAIAADQHRVRERLPPSVSTSIKWVARDHLHLTLAFLGHVDPPRAEQVVAAMQEPFHVPPFEVVFGGLGIFPPHREPRVLWVGVVAGAERTTELQRLVADRLAALDVMLEQRGYHPHVTIARWRSARRSARRAIGPPSSAALARLEVSAVTLFESRLSSRGSTYVALSRAPLGSPATPLP